MDIQVYEDIVDALTYCNERLEKNYGNVVVRYPSTNPTYPYTVVREIRNVPVGRYNRNYDKVSSVGYRIDIFAKTKGSVSKQEIARKLMKGLNDFMQDTLGLSLVSKNEGDLENDSSIYPVILTYSGNFEEFRRRLI